MHFKFIVHFTSLWINFTVSQIAHPYHQVAKKKKAHIAVRRIDLSLLTNAVFFSLIPFNMFVHFLLGCLFKKIYINIYISKMNDGILNSFEEGNSPFDE